jgi:DNA gyrase subunit B
VLQSLVEAHLKEWVDGRRSKTEARTVLQKIVDAARVRLTQKQQKDAARRKTALEGASMPPKLVDCRSTGVAQSELFIVEGDSALGSARMARSSEFQALLPIRGKILNVQKASLQQVLDNVECSAIVQVLGAGSGRTFDLSNLRYGRILIMADADVDGSHIRTLLITLFAKYMRPVIEAGRLFAAMPPLHKVTTKGRNPETVYTYTQQEMEATVARLEKSGKSVSKPVPRFKGLGEMDAEELWDTTMNPAVRTVRRITLDDVGRAEEILELLMGERVEPRKNWLIESSGRLDEDSIDA